MKTLKRNPWYIAAGCFLQMFLGMGLCSSFSMMLPEISAHTGISTGSISGNLTVAYLASFIVSMFFFKPLLRKFGAKKLLIFGDLLLMFHYILYSYAETIWFLRICGTLGGLVTLFACATPVSVVITNWFVDKRSSVLSVCIAAGMILMGVMADKLGSVKMVVLMHVVSIVGYACAIVLMNNTGSFALLLVTVILCGMNGPLDNATAPYLIPEAFGRKYYDEIIGSYAGAMMIGNVCVPMLLGGIISDGTAASFGLAWKIIIGFGAAAMVILLVGLFKGPYRKQYLALRAAEKQQKALGTAEE